MDIGLGLIVGVILSQLTTLNYPVCLALGVASTLLPDLDYVWSLVVNHRQPHSEHRDGLHYPLLLVPIVGLAGSLVAPVVGWVLALGTLLHFLHDSVGIGFGIKWLFPFRKNSYLFFFHLRTPASIDMPRKRFYSWDDAERNEMIRKYAYSKWIQYVYFRPNLFGMTEYAILVAGIITAVVYAY